MSMKTKSQIVAALALGMVMFDLAPAQAATITYLGQDQSTGSSWRDPAVAKPAALLGGTSGFGDPNGDGVYGSDGYYVFVATTGVTPPGSVTPTSSLPGYISGVTQAAGLSAWYDGSYGALNDPTVAGGLPNKQGMVLYSVTTNEVDFLTITLAQNKTFVMGVIGSVWGGGTPDQYDYNHLRTRQIAGGTADSTLLSVGTPRTANPTYDFFQIAGAAGDQFTVSAQHTPSNGGGASISGVFFEATSIPEPASLGLGLLGLGIIALYRWQRA